MGVARCGSRHDDADARRATNRPSTRPGRAGRRRTASCCCFSRALRRGRGAAELAAATRVCVCVAPARDAAVVRAGCRQRPRPPFPGPFDRRGTPPADGATAARWTAGTEPPRPRCLQFCTARRGSCSSALSWAGACTYTGANCHVDQWNHCAVGPRTALLYSTRGRNNPNVARRKTLDQPRKTTVGAIF